MDDLPRQRLAELVRRYGREVAGDARRCEALLRDFCPQHKREVFVLVSAAKESVGVELLDGSTGTPKEALFSRLTGRLHENLGLPESLSRWAVESWALALGVANPKDFHFPFKCPGCGASGTMPTQLAGQTVACPKCKVVLSISDDGRTVSVSGAGGAASQTVNASSLETASAEEHDLFAEFPRVSAEEILRQTLRRVLADGSVTDEERAEVAKLRKDLGIEPDLAARVLAEVKAEMGLEQPSRASGLSDTATPLPTGRPGPGPASRASSPMQQPVVPPGTQSPTGRQGKHSPADENLEQSLQEFFRKHGYWPRWDPKHRKPDSPPPRSPAGSGMQEPLSPAPPPRPAPSRPQRSPPPSPVPPVPPAPSSQQYQQPGICFHPVLGMLIASVVGTALSGLLSQNFSYVPYSPGLYLSWSDGPIAVGRVLGMLAGFVLAVITPIVWAKQDYQSLLGAVAKCVILIPIGLIICPLVGMCVGMLAALVITALLPVLLGIALGIAGGALLAIIVKTYTQRDEMLAGCWLGALAGGIISAIAWGNQNRFLANMLFVTPFAWAGYAGTNAINALLSSSPALARPYVRWLVWAYLGLFVLGMFSNSTILGLLVTGGLMGSAALAIYKQNWKPAAVGLGCIVAPLLGAWLGAYGGEILAELRSQNRGSTSRLPASIARPTGEIITNSIGMKLALIPAGEFLMGASDGEYKAFSEERPQHVVRITRPFYLGVYEVTQAEFEQVMGTNPSHFLSIGMSKTNDRLALALLGLEQTSEFPVENVSWDAAVEFCQRLSARPEERAAGRVYRLPTEAEWEYGCRGGTTTPFHFGLQLNGREANSDGAAYGTSEKGPNLHRSTKVGSYVPNAFGLYDMHGNVNEWCQDWEGPYTSATVNDPTGPASGSLRIFRGGSWKDWSGNCRAAARNKASPTFREDFVGFRVAMTNGPVGESTAISTVGPVIEPPTITKNVHDVGHRKPRRGTGTPSLPTPPVPVLPIPGNTRTAPSPSPTGKDPRTSSGLIVFVAEQGRRRELFSIRPDGSSVRSLKASSKG